ncbi:TetR/AcrR family transcriptional regulator; helix-turn-helix transcriptional regulator [Actinomycetospora endophytica]|uniref:TetR/AcrR family transcriptional regulator helix-turn-helix transcriptional regulator n=1 Tax=Actinomycetospora endophytica TaxID=2291215 RepID=A0ABS8PFF9_9PSEU|nr:TetR/AcrR family transcriptional regulator [Actinomycetospora endophytica]MCD2196738.1 TetR/AcrR family transcriptional regulator; helix-turn-helix transcriptional regulator [Actinomycetospora endophytica]
MTPSVTPLPASALLAPVSRWADDEVRERTRRTRRRLLLAAAGLFDEAGYRGASLSDILAAAGLTKGALYFHFRSKYALAEALLTEVERSWEAVVREIAGRGLDPLWRLLVETDSYVARWMYDPVVRGASRSLDDPELLALRTRWFGGWETATIERLTEASAAGLLAAEVDPRRAGRAVVAVATGNYALAVGPDDLWARMTESWEGLLPIMAPQAWREGWAASPWRDRPGPDPEAYRLAREP